MSLATKVQSLYKTVETMPDAFKESAMNDITDYETAMRYTPPLMFQQAYNMFWTLRRNITPNDSIQYAEIVAYTQLYRTKLEPFEVELIKKLDYTYISQFNEERK